MSTQPRSRPQPRPARAPRHDIARVAAPRGGFDRLFALAASPLTAAAALAVLAGIHFATAWRMLDPSVGGWTALSVRSVVCGVLFTVAIAAGVQRLLPALWRTDAPPPPDALLPDAVLTVGEGPIAGIRGRQGAAFRGVVGAVGAAIAAAGVITWALAPVFDTPGLNQGGTLELDPRTGAEAALVDLNGVEVRQNLDGLKFEVVSVDLGRLQPPPADAATPAPTGPASVLVRVTDIPRGTVDEVLLSEEGTTPFGPFLLGVVAIEPAPQPVGARVEVRDTTQDRTFPLDLLLGARVKDPAGPGDFALESIDPDYAQSLGVRIAGFVNDDASKENPQPFIAWEKTKDYDARHRRGRYALSFVKLNPGYQVRLSIARQTDLDLPLVGFALIVLGFALLMGAPQRAALRFTRGGEHVVAVSSINAARSAVQDVLEERANTTEARP